MKTLFILLTLSTLAINAQAEPTDENNNPTGSYNTASKNFKNQQSQPEFIYFDEPRYLKLIEIIEDDHTTITIKANLTIQRSKITLV